MSTEPDAPVPLPFGAAYDRLQEVAAELGADATMAPDRLIALLREGKGLERALRDHLERVEQEVRAIEDGAGAVPFRIADAAETRPAARTDAPPPARPEAASVLGSERPDAPPPARPSAAPPERGDEPAPQRPRPPSPPTLGFADDDDIPF